MTVIIDGTNGVTFPDNSTQTKTGANATNITAGVLLFANGGSNVALIPTFSAYQNASSQTVSQNTATKITFDATEWNLGNCYNTTTSAFTPTVSGYYQVTFAIGSQNVASAGTEMYLYKNGVLYKGSLSISAGAVYRNTMSCMVYLNGTTDNVQVYWYQNYAGTRATINASTDTYFQGCLVRGA